MSSRCNRSKSAFVFTEQFIQECLCFGHPILSSPKYEMVGFVAYSWESDYLAVSRSGYVHECEIKISHSDFLNEFRHKANKLRILGGEALTQREFYGCELLGDLPMQSPNYFWYVCPVGVISESECPKFAGLLYVTESGDFKCIRRAPCLHKVKFEEQMSVANVDLKSKFYYAMWNWIRRYWRNVK